MSTSDNTVSEQPDPEEVTSSDGEEEVQDQRKRKKTQQQGQRKRQAPGGISRVGAQGERVSLGKYGPGLEQHCAECWGKDCTHAHHAGLQVKDTDLQAYLQDECQVEETGITSHVHAFNRNIPGMNRKAGSDKKLRFNLQHDLLKTKNGSAKGKWMMCVQPYQLGLQVTYLVNVRGAEYGVELFKGLAHGFFHLAPPPEGISKASDLPTSTDAATRPAWFDRLKDDANPKTFYEAALASAAKAMQGWYEKHQLWEVCGGLQGKPPPGLEAPTQSLRDLGVAASNTSTHEQQQQMPDGQQAPAGAPSEQPTAESQEQQPGASGWQQGSEGSQGVQQWLWPPQAAESAANQSSSMQHAEWQAAHNGSTCRTYIFSAEVDERTQQYYDVSGPGLHELTAQQYYEAGVSFLQFQPVQLQPYNSNDTECVLAYNRFAQQLQQLGPAMVGMLQSVLARMQELQQQWLALQQQVGTVQASVNHLGYGVSHMLQQQQQQNMMLQQQGRQLDLLVELGQKQVQGSSTLLAGQVALHRSVQGVQQQVGAVQMDVVEVASKQVQLSAGSTQHAAAAGARLKSGMHSGKGSRAAAATTAAAAAPPPVAVSEAADAVGGVAADQEQDCETQWPGVNKNLSGYVNGPQSTGITMLVAEWQQGILNNQGAQLPSARQRTLPVKQLEGALLTDPMSTSWRSNGSIRKAIMYRKAIWLGFERRVLGHPLTPDSNTSSSSEAAAPDSRGTVPGPAAGSGTAAELGGGTSSSGVTVNSDNGTEGHAGNGSDVEGAAGSGGSTNAAPMSESEAIEDLELLARLAAKGGKLFSIEECNRLWSEPAARKEKTVQDKLKAVVPDYQRLSVALTKREWGTQVYEKAYFREIYSSG